MKTSREKNLIILGGVIVLLLAGYEYAYTPVMEKYTQLGEEIESKNHRLGKLQGKIRQYPEMMTKLKQLNNKLADFDKSLLPGDKPSLAAANLQKLVKIIVSRNKVTVTSEKIQPPVSVGRYMRIPIQISLRCLVSDLKNILYQIEDHKIALYVTQISIRVVTPRDPSEVEANIVIEGIIPASAEV